MGHVVPSRSGYRSLPFAAQQMPGSMLAPLSVGSMFPLFNAFGMSELVDGQVEGRS